MCVWECVYLWVSVWVIVCVRERESVCVSVCECVSVCICVSVYLCEFVWVCVSACVSESVCQCVSECVCISVYEYLCVSVCVSVYECVSVCVSVSVCVLSPLPVLCESLSVSGQHIAGQCGRQNSVTPASILSSSILKLLSRAASTGRILEAIAWTNHKAWPNLSWCRRLGPRDTGAHRTLLPGNHWDPGQAWYLANYYVDIWLLCDTTPLPVGFFRTHTHTKTISNTQSQSCSHTNKRKKEKSADKRCIKSRWKRGL